MALSAIFDVQAFVRFCVYLGYENEDIAEAIADDDGYGVDIAAAQLIVEAAVAERQRVDLRDERLLDEVARLEEHDLGHTADLPVFLGDGDDRDAQLAVGNGFRAARALDEAHDLGEDELMALLYGAFLIEPMHAALIVRTVLGGDTFSQAA